MIENDLLESNAAFELETELLPSKTYHVHENSIVGTIDGLAAIRQMADKILRTERFIYPIYTEYYGAEIERFIGEDFDFIKADLERTIQEALQSDDRIEGITDFEMEQLNRETLVTTFVVKTIVGSYTESMEVKV